MPKYEIMLILDPKSETKIADEIAKKAFGSSFKGFEKMDRTELAYPINNSTTATYLLTEFETDGKNIAEFTRQVNITKSIWRQLVINLTEEKANKIAKPRPERPQRDFKGRNDKNHRVNKKPQEIKKEENK